MNRKRKLGLKPETLQALTVIRAAAEEIEAAHKSWPGPGQDTGGCRSLVVTGCWP